MLSDKNKIVNMLQTLLLHAFNKKHCSSVLKTSNVHFSAKKSSAKAIKKLNKENKFIFGSLLETLPEKRKRQKKEKKASLSYAEMHKESKPDRTEEAWWLSRTSSSKLVSSVIKPNTDHFIYSDRINKCASMKGSERVDDGTENLYSENTSSEKCKISNTVPESQIVVIEPVIEKGAVFEERMSSSKLVSSVIKPNTDHFIYSDRINKCGSMKGSERVDDGTENLYSENTSSAKCKISNTVPESQVVVIEPVIEKGAVFKERKDRCNNLILPEVIIRNIPTFPLLREIKTKNTAAGKEINSRLFDPDDNRKEMLMYPSVTKVLNATMPESSLAALKRWRLKMIAELGEEGFQTHYRAVLEAGALFHDTIQNYLAGTPQKVDSQIEGCWESLESVLPNIRDVKLLESHVVHSNLLYRGVIDCVAEYKKSTVLIEWKKSDKQKPELEKTYDAPVQVSAYMGAINYDLKYEFQVEGGLVVVAYTDGSPAHIFPMSMSECQKYWSFWLKRLQQFWLQQSSRDSKKVKPYL